MGEDGITYSEGGRAVCSPKRQELGDMDKVILSAEDPFEAAVIQIVAMNRRKRKDYAEDGDMYSNFRTTAFGLGLAPETVMLMNVLQKAARLKALRLNGKMQDPTNESVNDTYLDLAVYAVILFSYVKLYAEMEGDDDGTPIFA